MGTNRIRKMAKATMLLVAALVFACIAAAQNIQVQGVMNGRSGSSMTLQTDSGNATVILTPDTQAEEAGGMFHARGKEMTISALVPGLAVDVQGATTPRIKSWPIP